MWGCCLVTAMFPVFWKIIIDQICAICTSAVLHLIKLLRADQSTLQCFLQPQLETLHPLSCFITAVFPVKVKQHCISVPIHMGSRFLLY